MASGGLFSSIRQHLPQSSSSSSPSSSSSSSSYLHYYQWLASKLPLSKLPHLLTLLFLALATLAFFLQWKGAITGDLATTYNAIDHHFSPSSPAGCGTLLSHSSPSFPYFRGLENHDQANLKPNIAITTSTSASLDRILPWVFFHKVIGVSRFYLFVEGKAATPETSRVLQSIPGVRVVNRTKELEEQQARSRIWNETWLSYFFYKPCNNELFVKQTLNMESGISLARNDGVDWILHLDTDELIHPAGTKEYSLRQLLLNVSSDIDMVVFPNYESAVESDDVQDPFSEVSLFKKNYDHVSNDTYDAMYSSATRGNPNYFLAYGNGKAIARIQDNLRPNGAHRWYNYMKEPTEMKLKEAAVLHYPYARFSDLTSRRNRCNCKPSKEDLQRCFMLEFDRQAYVIASTSTKEEMRQWYREHVVWDDEQPKLKLLTKGMFTRIYAPMVIIQNLREMGVFSSVIASASINSTGNATNSTKPMVQTRNLQEEETRVAPPNTRKVLEVGDIVQNIVIIDQKEAVPPLSPPVVLQI